MATGKMVSKTEKVLPKKSEQSTSSALKYSYLLIILLPLFVYFPSIKNGYVYFDDDILILENQAKLTNPGNIIKAFQSDAFFNKSSPYYRPLLTVSLILDAQISKSNPWFYHFMNIIYHILSCLALFWFLGVLGFKKEIRLVATLFFSVHPLMAGAVYWIPARNDILVTLFGLLFLSFGIKYIQNRKFSFFAVASIAYSLAIFSKESAILLPFLLILYLIYSKLFTLDKRKIFLSINLVIITILWYFLRDSAIANVGMAQVGFWAILANYPFPFEIIAKLFLPINLALTPVYSNFYTILGILISVLLLIYIFIHKPQNINLILFGLAWYILFSLPNMFVRLDTSSDSYDYLTHRGYLPIVGLVIILIAILTEISTNFDYKGLNRIIPIALLILFSVSSISQAKKYRDSSSFWISSIEKNPEKAWLYYFLGRSHFKKKEITTSEKYFKKAISLHKDPRFSFGLCKALYNRESYDSAFQIISEIRTTGMNGTDVSQIYVELSLETAKRFFEKGEYSKAVERCQLAINTDADNAAASFNMGIYLINTGESKKAATFWRRSIDLDSELKDAYRNLYYYYLNNTKNLDSTAYYLNQFQIRGGKI
ncbi:MAG: glycosyltransferase family 39 protein [Bacteroidia bacterium]